MLHLYTSNRLEALVERLATVLASPLSSVFQTEKVVVQSLGMRRWLSIELASRLGVCANVAFPFPQAFLDEICRQVAPEAAVSAGFNRESLPWRIMKLLPPLLKTKEFADLANYLSGERAELKEFQLAEKIAHTFDQYFAFRPEMILRWDAGRETHWQARLWRSLIKDADGFHPVALGKRVGEGLPRAPLDVLPARVSVFGVSTLPPFHLHLLGEIAARIDVHLFVMEPSPEWWADIKSPREEKRLKRQAPGKELHLDRGNPLLAALGRSGQDFLQLIFDLDPAHHDESFEPPDETTMLGAVQSDIFHLREPEATGASAAEDRSIQVHSCHSPTREMEVLYDQLLAMFERDRTLLPKDILVMMPDVDAYAPFIESVFDSPEEERLRIPFSIADRRARASSGVIDTFLRILELSGTRLPVSAVLAVLDAAAVRERFGLAESDMDTIDAWIRKTAIRWGIDGAHRAEFGIPEFAQNSWRAGLDRLLLGYALPANEERLFGGILPFDNVEGSLAETLGHFAGFIDQLFDTMRELELPRPLEAWQKTLRGVLDRFMDGSGETDYETVQVRRVIESLGETMHLSGFAGPVPLDVLRAHLSGAFEAGERTAGFLAGRVTFCALKPMRSIPFKVICLAGMNDTAFPRHAASPGFDLIAQEPKRGDRNLRDDDRYLFLETLLSARETLCITYVGRSMRDNSPAPPSVLVNELLDYLGARFAKAGRDRLVIEHPLQPFSPHYFSGDSLFSYSAENCRASDVARHLRRSATPFLSAPIAEPEEGGRAVTIVQLVRFFRSPVEYFLRDRLGIALDRDSEALDDREPFEIHPLAKYSLGERLTRTRLAQGSPAAVLPVAQALGELPPGHGGVSIFRDIAQIAEGFADTVAPYLREPQAPPQIVDVNLQGWRITGAIEGLYGHKRVRFRCATVKPKDLLAAWLSHLLLNHGGEYETALIGIENVFEFRPVPQAEIHLVDLLALYAQGLRAPLPYFPETSFTFARYALAADASKNPRVEAEKVWRGAFQTKGECQTPAFELAFRGHPNPLDEKWEEVALIIFRPLLDHCSNA